MNKLISNGPKSDPLFGTPDKPHPEDKVSLSSTGQENQPTSKQTIGHFKTLQSLNEFKNQCKQLLQALSDP